VALPTAFILRTVAGGWQTVASVTSLEQIDVAYLKDAGVFVVDTDDDPVALSEVSPHLGHRLLFCREADVFQGKHGEVFDRRGFYVDGPSPRGMDRVAVRVQDGLVQVDLDDIRPGAKRGAGPPLEPQRPGCRVPGPEPKPGFAAAPA
jgi:nitrite reductase/ring-hydroxylating ferredoxin subunit